MPARLAWNDPGPAAAQAVGAPIGAYLVTHLEPHKTQLCIAIALTLIFFLMAFKPAQARRPSRPVAGLVCRPADSLCGSPRLHWACGPVGTRAPLLWPQADAAAPALQKAVRKRATCL
jgi:hypothetical protein